MKAFTSAALLLATLTTSSLAMGASEAFHLESGRAPVVRHRRHHARRHFDLTAPMQRRASSKKCKGGKSKSKSKGKGKSAGSSSGSSNSTSPVSGSCGKDFISVNSVCIGMLPDGGGDGGEQDTMSTLNNLVSTLGKKHAYFGQYAQAQSGTTFDGSQLLQVMDDLKASGAIFQPAVMPTGGWQGLTESDDSQAQAICKVMKQFTDEGIEVWLRFAHEVNWYLTDGTYSGSASDFKAGWAAVAKACATIAPDVKMFFTPNIADLSTYEAFFPDDPSTVQVIGVDYYPQSGTDLSSAFTTAMQGFHDKYCNENTIFAIGETGLGYAGSDTDKVSWLQGIASAKDSMKYMTGAAWFNYQKGYNFKVVDPNDSSTTSAFVSWAQGS